MRRRERPQSDPTGDGLWSIPGGQIGPEEALEAAASRTLKEETGLAGVYLEQLYTFGDPRRDPRDRVIKRSVLCGRASYQALCPAQRIAPGAYGGGRCMPCRRWPSITPKS